MNRCVIIGAAPVADVAALLPLLRETDTIVAADGGIRTAAALGVSPQLIVSDCDSAPAPAGTFVRLPVHKDMTDTRAAMDLCFDRGYRDFLLLGCLGGRLDHTVAGFLSARQMTEKGCHVVMADERNEVTVLLPGHYALSAAGERHFSVFSMTASVKGLALREVAYPLSDYTLAADDPLCVSNALRADTATLDFSEGVLLLIFSKD